MIAQLPIWWSQLCIKKKVYSIRCLSTLSRNSDLSMKTSCETNCEQNLERFNSLNHIHVQYSWHSWNLMCNTCWWCERKTMKCHFALIAISAKVNRDDILWYLCSTGFRQSDCCEQVERSHCIFKTVPPMIIIFVITLLSPISPHCLWLMLLYSRDDHTGEESCLASGDIIFMKE